MAKRIKDTTRDYLKSIPLPAATSSYTVISHESVMDYAVAEITAQGFTIESEQYRCTADGQIAQGLYKLNFNTDSELSLMFAWSNSYNKQIRFKCATGAFINDNKTAMFSAEMGSWARKHTGTADAETIQMIADQFTNAKLYYNNLIDDKDAMKQVQVTTKRQAEILGLLFAEYEILTTEQASFIKQQIDKPSYFYNGGANTLWAFYNHVTLALQQSHPRTWMEDQRMLHWVINDEFDFSTMMTQQSVNLNPVTTDIITQDLTELVDPLYTVPNQTNILDQIAEVDSEVIDLDAEEDKDWEELESAGIITPIIEYTDPVGNTFEAPVVEPEPEIDESTLSPFEKMQLRLERANKRLESEVVNKVVEEPVIETPVASMLLTPEEMEEHKEELNQLETQEYELKHTDDYQDIQEQKIEEILELTEAISADVQEVTSDFTFDLDLSDSDDEVKFDDDFL